MAAMRKLTLMTLVIACVLAVRLPAQEQQSSTSPLPPQVPAAEPPVAFIGQRPTPVRNVRLDIAVTTGSGAAPTTLYQMTQVMGADERRNSFAVNRPAPVRGGGYQRFGMRLMNVSARVEGKDVVVGFNLGFEVPVGGPPAADQADRALPVEIEQTLNVKMESGRRTTVLSTEAPGVDGPVAVQMTATLLNP